MKVKNLSQTSFAMAIGMTKQSMSSIISGETHPRFEIIGNILSVYADVNPDWLLLGKGDMYRISDGKTNTHIQEEAAPYITKQSQGIPLYGDLVATGGAHPLFIEGAETITQHIIIPGFEDCDGALVVTGSSMTPRIHSGDIILCKKQQLGTAIMFGEIYLVITSELRTVKYIRRATKDDHIQLVPHNTADFDPVEVPLSEVLHLYRVRGYVSRAS